jgi:lysophospholipase L1-like esterase
VHDYNKGQNPAYEMTKRRPMETIRAINDWLQTFCKARGYVYLDYFSAMLDEKGFLKQELANDGLHPNGAGYQVMAPLAQAALDRVIKPVAAPKKKGFFERKKPDAGPERQ